MITSINTIETFLSRWIKLILFLVPLIPLYVSTSMVFPFITGKNFVFRMLVELAASLWFVLVLIDNKKWFRNSPMFAVIMVFAFVAGLADLFGVNPYKSFWSSYERMEGYITILHLLLYFVLLKHVFTTRRDWAVFFGILLGVSAVVSFFAIVMPMEADTAKGLSLYAIEYGTRARSTIGNPPFLAAYTLLSLFVGVVLLINEKRLYLRCAIAAAVLLNSAALYLTATRGALLGAAGGAVIFILAYGFLRKRSYRVNYMTILLLVAVIVLALGSAYLVISSESAQIDKSSLGYRLRMIFSDPSVLNRLEAWQKAMNAIKERPLLGWGQENFSVIYTVNPIDLEPEYLWLDRAHNILIDWLISAGVLGLLSYLALFISALTALRNRCSAEKISRLEGVVIVSGLAAYFVQNLSLFDTINSYMIFFALLAYIDSSGSFGEHAADSGRGKVKPYHAAAFAAALLLFAFTCYHLNYKPVRQNQISIQMNTTNHKSFSALSEKFQGLLAYNTFGDEDVRTRMLMISNYILVTKNLAAPGTSEFVQTTAEALWKGLDHNRYNLAYYYDVIRLYSRIAEYVPSYVELAEKLIKECIRINPDFQWPYMAMADIFVLKKDYQGAYENVRKISDDDPRDDKKLMKVALAAILISREDIMMDSLEKVRELRRDADPDIAAGKKPVFSFFEFGLIAENYMIKGDPEHAIQYYKEALDLPVPYLKVRLKKRYFLEISKVHKRLSGIYSLIGNEERAAEEARKAEEYYIRYLPVQADTYQ